jgi:hypothetical protein
MVFGIIPECRSASFRNKRSASPESPLNHRLGFPRAYRERSYEASTIKKQHATALDMSGVDVFVLYTLRHTCLTRWAKYMDPFTLHVLAGHTDMNTTKRYIHPDETPFREAMSKVWGGHSSGHSRENGDPKAAADSAVTARLDKDLTGATRRDRTGDLLITKQSNHRKQLKVQSTGGRLQQQVSPLWRKLNRFLNRSQRLSSCQPVPRQKLDRSAGCPFGKAS